MLAGRRKTFTKHDSHERWQEGGGSTHTSPTCAQTGILSLNESIDVEHEPPWGEPLERQNP